MQPSEKITSLLVRLWRRIAPRRRRQLAILLVLMVSASIAEILSLSALLPFLNALTAPERVFFHPAAKPLIDALGLSAPGQLLLPLTVVFVTAVLLAAAMRLLLNWANIRVSFAVGADLGSEVYRRTLYQPYAVHVARNSGEVISAITTKSNLIGKNILNNLLLLISSSIMTAAILVTLLAVNPLIALVAFGGFGLLYVVVMRLVQRRLATNSARIAKETTNVLKSLQEGFGGIRDVLIDGSQAMYCRIHRNADLPKHQAEGSILFIGQSPRFLMEALGMILIVGIAYTLAQQTDGIVKAIPTLGALVLGAQRLLPMMQQGYQAWTSIKGSEASLRDTLELLEQPLPAYADQPAPPPIPYRNQIRLENLSFRYALNTPWVLQDLNLTITKGARVGFIGVTGAGKSTLLDVVMGLLTPTKGTLSVDGQVISAGNQRAWQAHVAHVPQAIYLADSTIEENIAFGVPEDGIDRERVRKAAQQAQIADDIESWPSQYRTMVGERGVRLSGGQRQRIAIARALYKRADVIIFDEATGALDNETERAVMNAIDTLSDELTILIIAHRLSTLKNCTQIVELGKVAI